MNTNKGYPAAPRSRRSPPIDAYGPQHSHFFQTGQGGRTILPPLANRESSSSSRPPTVPQNYVAHPYNQPRATTITPQSLYGYQQSTGASPQFPTAFSNYEIHGTHERYSPQPTYPSFSRAGTPNLGGGSVDRRLPPLSTSPVPQGDRWQQPSYMPQQQPQAYHGNTIRSPAASYPNAYGYNTVSQASHYQYHGQQDHLPMNQHGHGIFDDLARLEPRSNTPYGRSSQSTHVSHSSHISPPPRSYSPPPVSPVSPEEPTIKKKRKRADAAQLKVLNETYNRTAFPSTEERLALAKMLDMSARSVQIWFQNKRQSMRQTNRQTASSSAHHPFSMGGQVDPMAEDLVPHPQAGYDGVSGHLGDVYLTGPTQDTSRSHGSHSHSHSHVSSQHHYPHHSSSRHRD
ncbi:hypothetical protein D9619_001985 [Psilocybe cf. subviscida]|uniref:Homeobox domain-containing protein n=1 Tax=Psilocybe cf. subviscida TaxID=2480587 RepID=A0A8H5F3V5_9AGAR|nr:hypothetical protein D9619_001985 [Psilocybe cf. subviscida]